MEFLDLLSADHHAIDDEVYRELGQVFTAAQIIELGFTCANAMGLHRFIHTLDVFGTSQPVIAYDPGQVDTAFARGLRADTGMSETVFVTGATGLAGANVCKLLIERGDASGPWPGPGPTPIRSSPWGSRSSPATSPTPAMSAGRPRAPTPPSTAPRSWAEPARIYPPSKP